MGASPSTLSTPSKVVHIDRHIATNPANLVPQVYPAMPLPPGGAFFPVMPVPSAIPSLLQQQQQQLKQYSPAAASPTPHHAYYMQPVSQVPISPTMTQYHHLQQQQQQQHVQQQQPQMHPYYHPHQAASPTSMPKSPLMSQTGVYIPQLAQAILPAVAPGIHAGHVVPKQEKHERHAAGPSPKRAGPPHADHPRPVKTAKVAAPAPPAADDDDDGGVFGTMEGEGGEEYRWRKYGQKIMKGSPYPRSYYKCTTPGCPAKKLVETAMKDGREVSVASFRGNHTHAAPGGRRGNYSTPGAGAASRGAQESDGEEEYQDGGAHSGSEGEGGKVLSPPQGRVRRAAAAKRVSLAQSSDDDVSDEDYGKSAKGRGSAKKRGRKPKFSRRNSDGEEDGGEENEEEEEVAVPKTKSSRRGQAAAPVEPAVMGMSPGQPVTYGAFPNPGYFVAPFPGQPPFTYPVPRPDHLDGHR